MRLTLIRMGDTSSVVAGNYGDDDPIPAVVGCVDNHFLVVVVDSVPLILEWERVRELCPDVAGVGCFSVSDGPTHLMARHSAPLHPFEGVFGEDDHSLVSSSRKSLYGMRYLRCPTAGAPLPLCGGDGVPGAPSSSGTRGKPSLGSRI